MHTARAAASNSSSCLGGHATLLWSRIQKHPDLLKVILDLSWQTEARGRAEQPQLCGSMQIRWQLAQRVITAGFPINHEERTPVERRGKTIDTSLCACFCNLRPVCGTRAGGTCVRARCSLLCSGRRRCCSPRHQSCKPVNAHARGSLVTSILFLARCPFAARDSS
jgi:hypothetical protein